MVTATPTTEPLDFDALVQAGQGPVTRYLLARLGSRAEAEELAQETFVRAYCAISGGERPQYPVPWLLAIARNVLLNALRGERYQRQLRERMGHLLGFEWQSPWRDRLADRLVIEEAVDSLPEELRSPVLLHYFAGLSTPEVAHHLAITPGAVKTRLWRARQSLRGRLEEIVSESKETTVYTLPRDLAARARLLAEEPPIYGTLSAFLQVGGQRSATAPFFEPLTNSEKLSLNDLKFAVQQLHAARVAGGRLLCEKLELWPQFDLFYQPDPVAVWEFLRSAEIGTQVFQESEEGRLVVSDGWQLGVDPKAPQLLADFKQAGLRHIWFTFVGLEQTHDDLCRRPGAFRAIVTAMERCRTAGIETGANIIVSTRNVGEVRELAELILSLGAERFIPTYPLAASSHHWAEYDVIHPTPEDLIGLPPQGMEVNWGMRAFWANPEAFTEAALAQAALVDEAEQPVDTQRRLALCVMPNFDLLIQETTESPTVQIANLKNETPAQVYEKLGTLEWPPAPPPDAELARRYGDLTNRKVYTGLWLLRQKWLQAWKSEHGITWLPMD